MKRSRAPDGGFSGLRAAAPYVRLFRGRVFVLKMGGEILRSSGRVDALMEQVGILNSLGVRLVLVHGGGPQSTELARRLGHEPRMVAGRRVTRSEDLRVAAQVLSGEINTTLLGACRKQGIHAVGVSGVDAGLVTATRRPPVHMEGEGPDPVDFGFVGDIESVDPSALHIMLEQGWVPVVSPLSADAEGHLLNINADTVAAALAQALEATKLVFTMAAPGILRDLEDPATLISYLDLAGLRELRDQGVLARGMLAKAAAIESAIEGGVPRVHLISGTARDSLLREIFTNEGAGTLVVKSIGTLSSDEQQAGQGPEG